MHIKSLSDAAAAVLLFLFIIIFASSSRKIINKKLSKFTLLTDTFADTIVLENGPIIFPMFVDVSAIKCGSLPGKGKEQLGERGVWS